VCVCGSALDETVRVMVCDQYLPQASSAGVASVRAAHKHQVPGWLFSLKFFIVVTKVSVEGNHHLVDQGWKTQHTCLWCGRPRF